MWNLDGADCDFGFELALTRPFCWHTQSPRHQLKHLLLVASPPTETPVAGCLATNWNTFSWY
jgi:hypothetical protein